MKIISTKKQEFFNLVLKYIIPYGVFAFVVIALYSILGEKEQLPRLDQVLISLIVTTAGAFLFWFWYHLLGKGPADKGACALIISNNELTYEQYTSRQSISWTEVEEHRVLGKLHKVVELISTTGNSLKFDYYLFSSSQRQVIFTKINENTSG